VTSDVDVFVDLPDGRTVAVGHLSAQASQAGMLIASQFQYTPSYLRDPARYALCPELPLTQGPITAAGQRPIAGCFTDSGPDRWGRNLLFAAEQRTAKM
jgi:serine/threonine-protein kinase HipA